MELDPASCYRAFASRDRRFDGRFVTAVVTTGVYCRPGCPARLPARRNVRFYAHAAAAEAAGFRPCLRCRPESAPGSAAWNGTSAVVARALRLIGDGALDHAGLETLAGRLGVTSRWLRALFAEQIGASPAAVARSRRVHFARRLLGETALPLEDVAQAAGFHSARRLHAAVRATFRRPPGALRGRGDAGAAPSAVALRLPARAPFAAAPLFAFFAARAVEGVERGEPDRYARTIVVDGAPAAIEVRALDDAPGLALRVTGAPPRALLALATRVARMFDLAADAPAIAAHLRRDPVLRRRVPAAGVRMPGAWDPFEAGVRAIVGQQVSVAAARTLLARLVRRCGTPLAAPLDGLTHAFPDAAAVAAASLDGLGLTGARVATLRGFAAAVAERRIALDPAPGLETFVARLTALPGIGEWTAHYLAMRALGEPDAFPADDLGVRAALAVGGMRPSGREVRARAERWRPWRAYAAIALWTAPAPRPASGLTPQPSSPRRRAAKETR